MKMFQSLALAVCLLVTLNGTALALKTKDRCDPPGTLVAKGVTMAPNTSEIIYTAPPARSGTFVLTQYCGMGAPSNVGLTGSVVGPIVAGGDGTSGFYCTTFEPGIALAPEETLTCIEITTYGSSCTIIGVVTKH